MKKNKALAPALSTVLVLGVLFAYAGLAISQAQILSGKALAGKAGVAADGRMKWTRGAGTDSTRISIPAAQASDFTDTTAWLDLSQFKFRQDYAKQPLVVFQVNKQLTTTTDSINCAIQYTNEIGSGNLKLASSAVTLTTVAASTAGLSTGDDGLVGAMVAVSPDAATAHAAGTAAAMPWRFVRLIVSNSDATGQTGRSYFYVTPLVWAIP